MVCKIIASRIFVIWQLQQLINYLWVKSSKSATFHNFIFIETTVLEEIIHLVDQDQKDPYFL